MSCFVDRRLLSTEKITLSLPVFLSPRGVTENVRQVCMLSPGVLQVSNDYFIVAVFWFWVFAQHVGIYSTMHSPPRRRECTCIIHYFTSTSRVVSLLYSLLSITSSSWLHVSVMYLSVPYNRGTFNEHTMTLSNTLPRTVAYEIRPTSFRTDNVQIYMYPR